MKTIEVTDEELQLVLQHRQMNGPARLARRDDGALVPLPRPLQVPSVSETMSDLLKSFEGSKGRWLVDNERLATAVKALGKYTSEEVGPTVESAVENLRHHDHRPVAIAACSTWQKWKGLTAAQVAEMSNRVNW